MEGANFDARKHLLEYDDVLNSQRATVYAQRDRIMVKDDLVEDVIAMLEEEVRLRVPTALADPDGPWKLLAWLDQIQPTLVVNQLVVPSFTLQTLLNHIKDSGADTPAKAQAALLDVADKSLQAEEEHLKRSLKELLETNEDRLDTQMNESLETIDTFVQGIGFEEEGKQRSSTDLVRELSTLLRVPLKLSTEEQRLLAEDANKAADLIHDRVEESLSAQAVLRVVGALEHRLETELGLNPDELAKEDWRKIEGILLDKVHQEFESRRQRMLGSQTDGQIAKELADMLAQAKGEVSEKQLLNGLMLMPETRVSSFDKKTHKQVLRRQRRLSFAFYAAQLLEKEEAEDITEDVLDHLKEARQAVQVVWGQAAWQSIANGSVANLNESGKAALRQALGAETIESLDGRPLNSLDAEVQQKAMASLGQRSLTESYRQLLLRVITELWVDYLTKMESLRISIGLEAYAQRDPLVQYKAQAYRMFQELFADMRSSMVNRMFVFQPGPIDQQPQRPVGQPAGLQRPAAPAAAPAANGGAQPQPEKQAASNNGPSGDKKRRRRRKKK